MTLWGLPGFCTLSFCTAALLTDLKWLRPKHFVESKVRYFSQSEDRQFMGQPGLPSAASYWRQGKWLQLLLLRQHDERCAEGCNGAGYQLLQKLLVLGKNAESSCFSQSANYLTCFKCKQGKNLQNIQPRRVILTTQMKHFDLLLLKSLAFLNLPPFNFFCSKRWKLFLLS